MGEKILVAMSGGVDSSAAALLLKEKGYDVSGLMLRLYGDEGFEESARDAKAVCEKIGIPFYTADYRDEFYKRVICAFISAYENGETPNPCVLCNHKVKFEFMLREADRIGAEKIATGHYVRMENSLIKKGKDEKKDQSYMLAYLKREQICRTLFPLGDMTKEEIREIAKNAELPVAHKKDSQDICFIPDGDYVSFICGVTKKNYPDGDFTDLNGNILGRHKGIIRYTTGQRKGLGLSLPAPMYVIDKDVKNNKVVLGTNAELFKNECTVTDVNMLTDISLPMRAEVKVRYSHIASPAVLYLCENGCVRVVFDEAQRAITRGQTAAFYSGDILLGGGKIE